jgi:hypothetical protein
MTGALGPKGDRWPNYRGQKHAQSASSYKGSIPAIPWLGLGSTGRCFALKGVFVRGCNYNYYDSAPSFVFWAAGLAKPQYALQQNGGSWNWCVDAEKVLRAERVAVGPG